MEIYTGNGCNKLYYDSEVLLKKALMDSCTMKSEKGIKINTFPFLEGTAKATEETVTSFGITL